MSRIIHTSLDVRGCLMHWNDRLMTGVFTHDDGRPMSAREAKLELMNELSRGRLYLPVGGSCEGFDYVNGGCPGHDSEPEFAQADGAR